MLPSIDGETFILVAQARQGMVGTARAIAVIVVAGLLAGCADPAKKGDIGSIELLEAPPPEAGKGSISGVVVDEAIRPLAGATISINGITEPVSTDEDGLFIVTDLEPGLYIMMASLADYLPIQTTAEVVAGETAKIRIVLAFDPTPKPYHTTLQFEWYDEVGQGLVDFAWDLFLRGTGVPMLCDRCYFPFTSDGAVEEFIIEATWEDSIPDPLKETEYYWSLDNLGEGGGYESDYFYNPGRASVGDNRFGNSTEFALTLASEEEWVTFQQTAHIFVTLFYLAPAPENWSFIAGNP